MRIRNVLLLSALLTACHAGPEGKPELTASYPEQRGTLVSDTVSVRLGFSGCEARKVEVLQGERAVSSWEHVGEGPVSAPTSLDVDVSSLELPRAGLPADVSLSVRGTCQDGATRQTELPPLSLVRAERTLGPALYAYRLWPLADGGIAACVNQELSLLHADGTERVRSDERLPCAFPESKLRESGSRIVVVGREEVVVLDEALEVQWRREGVDVDAAKGLVVTVERERDLTGLLVFRMFDAEAGTLLRQLNLGDRSTLLVTPPRILDGKVQLVTEQESAGQWHLKSWSITRDGEASSALGTREGPQDDSTGAGAATWLGRGLILEAGDSFAAFAWRDSGSILQIRSLADGRTLVEAPVHARGALYTAGRFVWTVAGTRVTQCNADTGVTATFTSGEDPGTAASISVLDASDQGGLILLLPGVNDESKRLTVLSAAQSPVLTLPDAPSWTTAAYDANGQILLSAHQFTRLLPEQAYAPEAALAPAR